MRPPKPGSGPTGSRAFLRKLGNDYGTLLALFLLCGYFSLATLAEQYPEGVSAADAVFAQIRREIPANGKVLIVVRDGVEDREFVNRLEDQLKQSNIAAWPSAIGQPADARKALESIADARGRLDMIAASRGASAWPIFENLGKRIPAFADSSIQILTPKGYRWPNFLKSDNLLNIANQISVIAIIAVGMTLVIIAGGIDLSVGSLTALSAVTAALLIRDRFGAAEASAIGMCLSCLGGVLVCALAGAFTAVMITFFTIPPFIATLAMMLVASGLAFMIAAGQSIYQVPDSFVWLGRGADLAGVPNAVVLMLSLYVIAHILMTRTSLGRHIYAVGGNPKAAQLSGVSQGRTLLIVYSTCGALSGLGGVVMASQLKSGAPTYGQMYELYAIAAVVVGGTSLSGGSGRVLGTLIGALIIAVIQNGMNLTNVESYRQKVVLGLVILGAVLLDKIKKRGWRLR